METVVRVAIIYLFLLVGLRILGKREFGELSPLEFIALLLIPELVSQGLVREDFSLTNAVIAVATLLSLVYLTSLAQHVSRPLERVISGEPTILVRHGQFLDDNLNRERISEDELMGELRKAGLSQVEQVQWAILETDGKIAFIPQDGQIDHSIQHLQEDSRQL